MANNRNRIRDIVAFTIRALYYIGLTILFLFAAIIVIASLCKMSWPACGMTLFACLFFPAAVRLGEWAFSQKSPPPAPKETEPRYQGPWLI